MAPVGRIDAYLVCGGKFHDFDYARRELLRILGEDEDIRTKVAQDYADVAAITASDLLVTYTCDVRPTREQALALRAWVEAGGRWFALHGTNSALDIAIPLGSGPVKAPKVFPEFAELLGSQFVAHPPIAPYRVEITPGAEQDPLVVGVPPFDANDELYISEYHGELIPLLQTRWTGDATGFEVHDWSVDEPRLVLYRRPLGAGEIVYFTLGHRRSAWDMNIPAFDGQPYPVRETGSWELEEFHDILRRGFAWATEPARARNEKAAAARAAAAAGTA